MRVWLKCEIEFGALIDKIHIDIINLFHCLENKPAFSTVIKIENSEILVVLVVHDLVSVDESRVNWVIARVSTFLMQTSHVNCRVKQHDPFNLITSFQVGYPHKELALDRLSSDV